MKITMHSVAFSGAVLALASLLPAQQRRASSQSSKPKVIIYSSARSYIEHASWRWVGPANHSGRIVDLAVHPGDRTVWYVAAASGGVWKTVNHGLSFRRVFGQTGPCTIGDIALDPSHPDTIWVGTGEANNQRSSYWGDGVYKSRDGGKTWKNVGLRDSHHIARILVDPSNSNRVLVASLGRLYSPGGERGLYLTEDGGESWKRVLYVNEDVGVVDVAFQPGNPQVLLAASYERRRRAWHFDGAGPGSRIWRSSDGGRTWKKVEQGLPAGELGRIGIDWARSKPGTVFLALSNQNPKPVRRRSLRPSAEALLATPDGASLEPGARAEDQAWEREQQRHWDVLTPEGSEEDAPGNKTAQPSPIGGEVYRSDDAGLSWRKVSTQNVGGSPAYYYGQIRVDPSNEERLYVLSVPLWVSTNGGKKFRRDGANRIHVDHHALWIDPEDGDHLLLGNDGGLFESWDAGKNWAHHENLPIGQYYAIGVDMAQPYRIFGGTQDNGTWCIPSQGPTSQGVRLEDCFKVSGGDGFFCVVDPLDNNIVYTEYQFGGLLRTDLRTMQTRGIRPRPAKGELPYRFNWMSPIVASTHGHGTLYYAGNKVFKSSDRGDTWRAISGDLSKQDAQKLAGNVPHCTVTMLAESPKRAGLLWAGTDDGKLWMTADDGGSWQDLSSKMPAQVRQLWVSRIVPSSHAEGRCYVSYTGYREDHFEPYVFVTDDYGLTWRQIQGNLPHTHPVNCIAESPRNPDLLFVGTEQGVYATVSGGGTWHRMGGTKFAQLAVHDLLVHPREQDLIVGTHGLGIHIANIAALENASGERLAEGPVLVPPHDILRFPRGTDGGYAVMPRQWTAKNPVPGTKLAAWIPMGAKKPRLIVRDMQGRERSKVILTEEQGLHVVDWKGAGGQIGGRPSLLKRIGRRMSTARSRLLPLGEYRVELEIAGKVVGSERFRIWQP
ncbi:MAG: glycosyl hydrolase [Planctomycetota bacterium]|nr:MAG: glycosyl hydrolase [Planctomycetota bacterium]